MSVSASGGRRSPDSPPRRIALYLGPRSEAGPLRDYAARKGWQVVAESRAAGTSPAEFETWLEAVAAGRPGVDMVVVASLTDAFDSAAQCAGALRRLHRLGIDFHSHADPLMDTTRYQGDQLAHLAAGLAHLDGEAAASGAAADASALLTELGAGLGDSIRKLLDLQIESLARQQREALEAERRLKMRAPLGQVLTVGLIMAGYAAALAAVSSRSPLTAVINGDRIAAGISAGATDSVNSLLQIPEPLRAAVFTLIWSGALFAVRSFPLSSRLGAAGVVFAGLANVVVLALASAVGLWFLGTAGAAVGMLVLVYVVYDFCAMVVTIEGLSGESGTARPRHLAAAARWLDPPIRRIERFFNRIHPARGRLWAALFIALPAVSVAGVLAAVTWPSLRIGFFALGFLVWGAWGIGVTRPALRLPLWSLLGWTLVFLFFLSSAVDFSTYFLVLALILLLVTTTIAIFRWPAAEAVRGRVA